MELKVMMVVMVTMGQMELKAMMVVMVQAGLLVLMALLARKAHLAEEEGPVLRLQKMVHQLGP